MPQQRRRSIVTEDVRWCRIEVDGQPAYGLIEDRDVLIIDAPPYEMHRKTGRRFVLRAAKFLPPVTPRNFYAIGLNFRSHIDWANRHLGTSHKVPAQADIGSRSPNALIGSGADIVIPEDAGGPVHFEGELVAIVGRQVQNVPQEHALDCVAGYTLGNDVSVRAKNGDTSKPMGPLVATSIDPMNQVITVRVNGKEASSYNTKDALFALEHLIARVSADATLWPGDVIWLGCGGATLPALKPGDLVEVVNDAIGVLANHVVKAR